MYMNLKKKISLNDDQLDKNLVVLLTKVMRDKELDLFN